MKLIFTGSGVHRRIENGVEVFSGTIAGKSVLATRFNGFIEIEQPSDLTVEEMNKLVSLINDFPPPSFQQGQDEQRGKIAKFLGKLFG